MNESVKIIPLGGYGEIGKNMTIIEYRKTMIMIDAGILFPSSYFPGIEYIIPDITYVKQNIEKFAAIIVTHGHEDHIGAIPYILEEVGNPPIYAKRLSIELIKKKLTDHDITNAEFVTVTPEKTIYQIKDMFVEFIHVNHSILDASAILIKCGTKKIFFTADFKMDYTPINEPFIDLHRIAAVGKEGVDVLIVDSTNAERPGMSYSERIVGLEIDDIVSKLNGRVIIATFASNISRIIQILAVAKKYNRKIVIEGRSLRTVIDIAAELGYIDLHGIEFISLKEIASYRDFEVLFLVTGSQGEPLSVLQRISQHMHSQIKVKNTDTVLISAKVIPGNEMHINKMINNLFKLGADVYYENISEIHVSGHASQEEIKLLANLVKPKYIIPYHGEYKNMIAIRRLMGQMGYADHQVFLIENGTVFTINDKKAYIEKDIIPYGKHFIENNDIGFIDENVIQDRKRIGEEGAVFLVFSFIPKNGDIIFGPEIAYAGIQCDESVTQSIAARLQDILASLEDEEKDDMETLKTIIERRLRRFLKKSIGKEPLVVAYILESNDYIK